MKVYIKFNVTNMIAREAEKIRDHIDSRNIKISSWDFENYGQT